MKHLMLVLSALVPLASAADSPLTSTPFHEAYLDVKIVKYALEKGAMDKKIAKYLMKGSNPTDVKLAAINALGWGTEGQNNSGLFKELIAAKYRMRTGRVDQQAMTATEAICMAYLIALDDYFNPKVALPYVELALSKDSTSYSIHMIAALIKAQVAFDTDWCEVYELAYAVEENPFLVSDMREGASAIIMDYMSIYSGECE